MFYLERIKLDLYIAGFHGRIFYFEKKRDPLKIGNVTIITGHASK